MSQMIDLSITKARLTSIGVTINKDGLPDMTASITLYGANDVEVTSYSINSYSWTSESKRFDIPDSALPLIRELEYQIEKVVVAKCMGEFKQLPEKSSSAEVL